MSGYHREGEPDIIDMKRSGIKREDWSDVMSARVVPKDWKKTRKVIPASYGEASKAIRPQWVFEWNNNTPEAISNWALTRGSEPVTSADGYWPEGVPPNQSDNFIRGDLIFSKVSVEDYLDRRHDEVKRGSIGKEVLTEQFQNQLKAVGASVSKEEITKAIGF